MGVGLLLFSVSLPVLIVSLALSLVYMFFSVVMLKGVKEVRIKSYPIKRIRLNYFLTTFFQQKTVYILPWLVWSVMYFLISLGIFIYSVVLGGDSLVQKLVPPLIYVAITSAWAYCFVCVLAYYLHLKNHPETGRKVKKNPPANLPQYKQI